MSSKLSRAVALARGASRRALASAAAAPAPAAAAAHQVVFDTRAKLLQRNRAGARADAAEFDYLRDEAAARLVLRLGDVLRRFPAAVELGANSGNVLRALRRAALEAQPGGAEPAGGVRELRMVEPAEQMLLRGARELDFAIGGADESSLPAAELAASASTATSAAAAFPAIAARALVAPLEGAPLPFADASADLVLSSMAMHWVNDLPGLLREALRVLRPDGCFLACMAGGETLQELRSSFYQAELEVSGGASPHASPMVSVADAGNLMTAAGFALTTVDADTFTLEYPSPRALFRHLRAMGESNAALGMRQGARRRLLDRAAELYQRDFASAESADGSVVATVQLIFMIGWKPAASQPLPKARGSVPKGFGQRKLSGPSAAAAASAAHPAAAPAAE
jgi:NADH dehydrogenase [ubiquinone] 1 alpha subcomplex assembly factor 5